MSQEDKQTVVECPKCRKAMLLEGQLADHLSALRCQACKGSWLPAENYKHWQGQQQVKPVTPEQLAQIQLEKTDFKPSPLDPKAALCPECGRYLARARVKLKTPFYIERCPKCEGIWCDEGEWEILSRLGLSATIAQLFEKEWQMQVREQESIANERQTATEKLGPELAKYVFDLGELLAKHPHGDYAISYLVRKVINKADVKDFLDYKRQKKF